MAIVTSCSSTPTPFVELEKILGTPCKEILSNDGYKVTSIMDIQIAKKATDDIFGVSGQIEIYIMPDDEHISIVTWQSTNNSLTETEISQFIDNIEKAYKEYEVSEYLWQTDKSIINLQVDENDNSLTVILGLN